ncbi:MAG TPA: methyltransferase domain-containing protein, partial [Terriglobales bacterium]|nr:methyltransferase domain-containing protein [Terriglobales bacterium]
MPNSMYATVQTMLRKSLKHSLALVGYEIHKIAPEEPLYGGYRPESLANRRFYNVGAGNFYHRYWTNIDYESDWYRGRHQHPFLNYDLTSKEPLPIETGSAEIIYSSHTVEHIPDDAAAQFFSESYRALVPGGVLRLTMPDFDRARRAYRCGDNRWFLSLGCTGTLPQNFLHNFASQLACMSPTKDRRKFSDQEIVSMFSNGEPEELLNQLTSLCSFNPECPADHINWWNHDKAERFLRAAGFSTVYRSAYAQ